MRVRLIGVDLKDTDVFPRDTWTIRGSMPEATGEILVATTPASLLELDVGDVVTLEARTVDGALNAMRYTISGILTTGNPFTDNQTMVLPLASAGQLLAANGRVTHVAVRLPNRDNTQPFANLMEEEIGGVESRTWQQESAAMLETQKMRQVFFDILGISIMLMAAAGIANTVLMAAFERVREIGTLRSMGMQRTGVMKMFALEGFWMGLLGGIIGTSLGGWLCYHFSQNGIDLANMMGKSDAMGNIPMSTMLYLEFSSLVMFVAIVVAIVVAMLASIYPAWIASRVSPAQAVRAQ